jgi:16S rRNA processing protein RimM
LLLVGRVARAHGNKGQVIVNPETDFAQERFAVGHELVVEDVRSGRTTTRRITAVRFHGGRPIIALAGVDTMTDAEALAGADLKMPGEALGALPANTFYRHDLVGCEVKDAGGHTIGRVTGVEGPLEQSRLVVAGANGELLIPMVEGICVSVDTAAQTIVVDPPAGLMDLNSAVKTGDSES